MSAPLLAVMAVAGAVSVAQPLLVVLATRLHQTGRVIRVDKALQPLVDRLVIDTHRPPSAFYYLAADQGQDRAALQQEGYRVVDSSRLDKLADKGVAKERHRMVDSSRLGRLADKGVPKVNDRDRDNLA